MSDIATTNAEIEAAESESSQLDMFNEWEQIPLFPEEEWYGKYRRKD